jgi:hypothetical protein
VLLSHIACFRSAVTYDTLHAVAVQECKRFRPGFWARLFGQPSAQNTQRDPVAELEADIDDLRARGLLQQYVEDDAPRYDLHPIVRCYVYERLGQEERQQAHTVLIVIFEAMPEPPRRVQQAGNAAEARQQADAARRLATCDGPPDYTYYAAYVEAERVVGE